ncbi:VOC family protein [Aestuariivirga litoralis]|uniref:VOC family protein n=1 Tax=Aestuariivirga litoralis TaxID=2650924 RepID=UPI0018C6EF6B|nr:VOC family protein [Aestuariivirga litoralis]
MRVDHLVWYCADLAEGERIFAETMDVPSAYGGEHPGGGTANRLLSLSDTTYLEILGRDPGQPESNLYPELRGVSGHGLYHWAIGGMDLEALRSKAVAAGLAHSDLVSGGRTLPNGNWLGWTCFGINDHGFGALVPFFIDWQDSEHPAKTAPRGGKLVGVEVFSPKAAELRKLFDALGLDIKVTEAAKPGLTASIESRFGTQLLRMFDPVPPGFSI